MPADAGDSGRAEWIVDASYEFEADEAKEGPPIRVAIVHFVAALGRAVHAFVTYPKKSPAREDVLEIVEQALLACDIDRVVLQVTSEGLRYDGQYLDVSGSVERGLLVLMHRSYVAEVQIARQASTRDLGQFCALLADPDLLVTQAEEFSEILENRGVRTIEVHVIASHQTIEAGSIPADRLELVAESRARRQKDDGSRPAEGGWVRVDPSVSLGRLELSELPLVLPDPGSVAVALRQLNGRRRESMAPEEALAKHFDRVAALCEKADPQLARRMYEDLAEAVRKLPESLRSSLLEEELLPALVDDTPTARVVGYFTDQEIADALPALLDLGVGGIEMLSLGLANLDLGPQRRDNVLELLNRGVTSVAETDNGSPADGKDQDSATDRTQSMLTLRTEGSHELAPLARFDLAVDTPASEALAGLVREVEETDLANQALRCHTDLVALSSDPRIVRDVLRLSRGLFHELDSRGSLPTLADAAARYAAIADGTRAGTEEVADLVRRFLSDLLTPEFVRRLATQEGADAAESLGVILSSLGSDGADLVVATLQAETDRKVRQKLLAATQGTAATLSSGLAAHLSNPNWYVVRNVLSLLGHSGPGGESTIAACLKHDHPKVIREAFLALARIGSPAAITITARALRHESPAVRERAAEAIWHFPPEISRPPLREALSDTEWLLSDPETGCKLIRGGRRRGLEDLPELVGDLARWRFALWNRRRMALGREAQKAVSAGE